MDADDRPSWMDGYQADDAETLVLPASRAGGAVDSAPPFHNYEEGLRMQQELYGRTHVGAALFGLLVAAAVAAVISALVGLAWVLVSASTVPWLEGAKAIVAANEPVAGAIAGLLVLFIALFCGGYVAGRMARFSGSRQGVAVWIWALAIAVASGTIAAYTGYDATILSSLEQFALQIFIEEMVIVAAIVAATLVLGVSLTGAVLGGAAGMRYHRAVDRVWP